MERALLAGLVGIVSLGLSAALVPFSMALGRRLGVLDHPGGRKTHRAPTPRLGGLGVFVSFVGIVVAGYAASPSLDRLPWIHARFGDAALLLREAYRVEAKLLGVLGGAALVLVVGLADDLWGSRFPAWLKASGLLIASLILVGADVRTSFLPYAWMN